MDVLSVGSCVEAVIAAHRDASRLIQRLKDKQETSEDFLLPEALTRELEDSLSLGCIIVQSQYDHDVRGFGETYARGDAIAREQIKDIVITLQTGVVSRLREIFMDEASVDLHLLKETSDDSRVNATVCLGQLYQRMSSAAASMQHMSNHTLNLSDTPNPHALGHSSSQSTHSSGDGPQSTASYTTYGSRPKIAHQRCLSDGPAAQAAAPMSSDASSNRTDQPKRCIPGEQGVPALPYSVQRGDSHEAYAGLSSGGWALERVHHPDGYAFERSSPDVDAVVSSPASLSVNVAGQDCQQDMAHCADASVEPLRMGQRRNNVPMNPDYSTLEPVDMLEAQGYTPQASSTSWQLHQQYVHQTSGQWPQLAWDGHRSPVGGPRQQLKAQDVPAESIDVDAKIVPASVHTETSQSIRVPTMSSVARPLSIRSSSSGGSRVGGFTLRRALPPGIVDAVRKKPSSTVGGQEHTQPRYVKRTISEPGSAQAQLMNSSSPNTREPRAYWSSQPDSCNMKFTEQAVVSSDLQMARSDLKLPSESNLAGFCKGAVRQQLGSRKKGFTLDHKKGRGGQEWLFQCTKCSFAGPAIILTALPSGGRGAVKREKTFDMRVRTSPGGIKYRWIFLAKSHILNTSESDPSNSNDRYGCYFCYAEGATKGRLNDMQVQSSGERGGETSTASVAPAFEGLHAFLAHLETHRLPDRIPGLIVANEMNCIVGRVADESEDFDLNLPPPAE